MIIYSLAGLFDSTVGVQFVVLNFILSWQSVHHSSSTRMSSDLVNVMEDPKGSVDCVHDSILRCILFPAYYSGEYGHLFTHTVVK